MILLRSINEGEDLSANNSLATTKELRNIREDQDSKVHQQSDESY